MIIEKVLMPASLTKNFEIWVLQDYEYFPMDGLGCSLEVWILYMNKTKSLKSCKRDEGWWMIKDDDF